MQVERDDAPTQYDIYGKPPRGRTWMTHVTTLVFIAIAASHMMVTRSAQSRVLVVISLVLAFDCIVIALGGTDIPHYLLQYFGRLRYFSAVLAWPYFLSFAFSLGRSCHWIADESGVLWESMLTGTAIFCTILFIGREVMWFLRGPPLSMVDPTQNPDFGDCLPSNALFGGSFGINKHEAEDNRIVFIPLPARAGIATPSGMCVLEHLCVGVVALTQGVYSMFLCALVALVSRAATNLYFKERRTVVARLIPRMGEALWLWGCLWQESCAAR